MANGTGAIEQSLANRGCWLTATQRLVLLFCIVTSTPCAAETLKQALIGIFPGVLREDGAGLASVFSRTVAASFPVTGTSSAYVYRFDPASDSFQRLNVPLGPVFSERAATVGRRKLSVAVNYLIAEYDSMNGQRLDAMLSSDPTKGGDHITICASAVLCEPVAALAQLDLEAEIVTFSATYGVTPDMDISVSMPLIRTALRASTTFTGPDPRLPGTATSFPFHFSTSTSEAATGPGDLLLRLKYVLTRSGAADLAAGLTVSMPTGDRDNFHGTGDTLIGAAIYASHTYAERIEPHLNISFVADAAKLDRSQARYSAGVDLRTFDWLTLSTDFLGRSDITRPDSINRPVFLQVERADVWQFSTGAKVTPLRRTGLFFNAILPLNEDGLRSNLVVTFGVEGVF